MPMQHVPMAGHTAPSTDWLGVTWPRPPSSTPGPRLGGRGGHLGLAMQGSPRLRLLGDEAAPCSAPHGVGALHVILCFCALPRTLCQHWLRADPPSPPSPQYSQSQMLATVIKTQPDSFSPECTPTHVPTK